MRLEYPNTRVRRRAARRIPQRERATASAAPGRPETRRWTEQRWLIDNVIHAVSID
jgi:hypothetical protein